MKVKDIPFSDYTYRRIHVITHRGAEYFPENAENAVLSLHGEEEIAEDPGLSVSESGFLVIPLCPVA